MGQVHYLHRSTPPPVTVIEAPKDYAEHDRIASVIAETRKYRWQQRVMWGAIAVGYLTIPLFCFQMGRAF